MAPVSISPEERIRELSAINLDVAGMLTSAGQAVHALTSRPLDTGDDEDSHMANGGNNTVKAHQDAFTKHTKDYLTGLQSVFARLRRQAYALEDAGIISPEATSMASGAPVRAATSQNRGGSSALATRTETERIKNGGLGNFDVGWLNSRGNSVGEEKEAELMRELRELLEGMLAQSEQG